MEFQVLGPVEVLRDGHSAGPAGVLGRTLLGVLLVHRNRPVSVDALSEALWPGSSGDTSGKLNVHAYRLRSALGDRDRLLFAHGSYRLRVLPDELDADRFESIVDEAVQAVDTDPDRCVRLVRKALGLWRGEPYTGLDEPAVADEARRLDDRRLTACEVLYRAELAHGRHAAVVDELTGLAGRHPLHEGVQWLLITALHRSGRATDALRAYRAARHTFVEELGIEPGPALRDLEQHIRAGQPVTDRPLRTSQIAYDQSYRALAPAPRRLFRLLGLHPGDEFDVAAAAALTATDPAEAVGLLETLLAQRFVQQVRPHRYRLPGELRAYAKERAHADEREPDRWAAIQRLASAWTAPCTALTPPCGPMR